MIISAAELLGRAKTNPIDNHRPAFFVDKFAAQPTRLRPTRGNRPPECMLHARKEDKNSVLPPADAFVRVQ
jgi:hypothetical protein